MKFIIPVGSTVWRLQSLFDGTQVLHWKQIVTTRRVIYDARDKIYPSEAYKLYGDKLFQWTIRHPVTNEIMERYHCFYVPDATWHRVVVADKYLIFSE